MRPVRFSKGLILVLSLAGWWCAGMAWAQSTSHVRIVRLSFVEGTVTVQRPDVPEWATASVNTPIQEGFKLSTAEGSFAEVEFENASTARLGQLSMLEFTQLALSASGGKLNRLGFQQGYATFNVIPEQDDIYEVKTPNATLTPYGKTMFRVDLDESEARVEVFKGSVEVSSPFGSATLAKNAILTIRPNEPQPFEISQGITKDEWDQWVDERQGVTAMARNRPVPGVYSPELDSPLYGWNDLWGYGGWSYLPGYGYGWFPSVPIGWVPYSFGQWCWYPGLGYVWISSEPWGWMPYHYGEWLYVSGIGWGWLPGGFGVWSPALVTWSQGPGWIGWAPRSRPGGGVTNCAPGQPCRTTISINTFQSGEPVTPRNVLAVGPAEGRLVTEPEIPPTRLAMLPGRPFQPGTMSSGTSFDPVSGRFVAAGGTNPFAASAGGLRGNGSTASSSLAGVSPRPAPKTSAVVVPHTGTSAQGLWDDSSSSTHHVRTSPSIGGGSHTSTGHSGRGSSDHSGHSSGAGIGGGGGGSHGGGGGSSGGGHSSSGTRK